MSNLIEIAGMALTATLSFSLALLLGWTALAGVLRLLPDGAPSMRSAAGPSISPRIRIFTPVSIAAQLPAASPRSRRARVVLTQVGNHSGRMYTVRPA